MWTYFIITWFVVCPIGNHPVSIERTSYMEELCGSKNLEECPIHHIALFTTPKKIIRVETVMDGEKSTNHYIITREIRTEIVCTDKKVK